MYLETQESYGEALYKLARFCMENGLSFGVGYNEAEDNWELSIEDFDIKKTKGYIKRAHRFCDGVDWVIKNYLEDFDSNWKQKPE